MVMEKLRRKYTVLFSLLIFMTSCSNMYENIISDILCVQEVRVISSKRYESRAVGEWYVLERYILFGDSTIQLKGNKDMEVYSIKNHPILEDYYWLGWNPVSVRSSMNDILLESTRFHTNNLLVHEYEECCHNDACYYTIIVRDSTELHNDLYEKIAVVFDTITNTIYICNYHY